MSPPVTWPTNEYWGRRSGTVTKNGNRIFKGRRGGVSGGSANSGPTGRALRRKQRRGKNYANRKMQRRSALGHATANVKGRKIVGRPA